MISNTRTMGINAIVLGLLATALILLVYQASLGEEAVPTTLPWVPIQVGKQRSFHSQTRDASLYTERMRRTAIISNPDLKVGNKSSGNGSLEWNFLTGICLCPPRKICKINSLVDGGYYSTDTCDVLDGMGSELADFGNAFTETCGGPPNVCNVNSLVDGGYYSTDTCDILDGMGNELTDFGNAFTETCEGVCPPVVYETQEGGNVTTDVCDVFDGDGMDIADFGGAVEANVC